MAWNLIVKGELDFVSNENICCTLKRAQIKKKKKKEQVH